MSSSLKMLKDHGIALDNPTTYRSAVGSLQYLTLTRPEISFAINKLSQFCIVLPIFIGMLANISNNISKARSTSGVFCLTSSFTRFADADWVRSPPMIENQPVAIASFLEQILSHGTHENKQ